MASHRADRTKNTTSNAEDVSKIDLLLHPELLSQEFIQLMLHERKIAVGDRVDRDQLTELYLRHVIPLPQRDLPRSRWGRRMEKSRESPSSSSAHSSNTSSGRKRPLIVFDGSSTNTGGVKLKKPDSSAPMTTDRLKPPVSSISLSNPIRKLSVTSTNCSSSNSSNRTPVTSPGADHSHSVTANSLHSNNITCKRTSSSDGDPNTAKDIKSPETKKKIQHITWP